MNKVVLSAIVAVKSNHHFFYKHENLIYFIYNTNKLHVVTCTAYRPYFQAK